MRFVEEGSVWKLPGLLYADYLVLCSKSEQDSKVMVEHSIKVCRRSQSKCR